MSRVLLVVAFSALASSAAAAQGHGPKRAFLTQPSHALAVTQDVLVHQGYEIVRVEESGNDRVVVYRAGNHGRGKGKGPPMKFVVRQMGNHVVFVDTPQPILVEINTKIKS
jgi:hypothetical protein